MGIINFIKEYRNRAKPNQLADPVINFPFKRAGVRVTEETAMRLAAVFGCIRYISSVVSILSWHVYRQNGKNKDRLFTPLANLLNRMPCKTDFIDSINWRVTLLNHVLSWGNGYAEIVRDSQGRPVDMPIITPNRVQPYRNDSGDLLYRISNMTGEPTILAPNEIYHVRGLGFDGVQGYSVIDNARQSIGVGMAADEFAGGFYENNAKLGLVIKKQGSFKNNVDRATYVKNMRDAHAGPKNAFQLLVIDSGDDLKEFGIPARDAQFIESKKFNVEEICRFFGVPPHKIQHQENLTFNNVEQVNVEVVNDCLMPWIRRLELEAENKLTRQPDIITRLNVESLLRGDIQTRTQYYREMRYMGALNVNEIREKEGLNSIGPDGDKYIVQTSYTDLEKIGEEPEPPPQLLPPPPAEDQEQEARNIWRPFFDITSKNIINRAWHRVCEQKKLSNDEFRAWANDFLIDHLLYTSTQLNTSIGVFVATMSNGSHNSLNKYVEKVMHGITFGWLQNLRRERSEPPSCDWLTKSQFDAAWECINNENPV